jgi:hypothetical protein
MPNLEFLELYVPDADLRDCITDRLHAPAVAFARLADACQRLTHLVTTGPGMVTPWMDPITGREHYAATVTFERLTEFQCDRVAVAFLAATANPGLVTIRARNHYKHDPPTPLLPILERCPQLTKLRFSGSLKAGAVSVQHQELRSLRARDPLSTFYAIREWAPELTKLAYTGTIPGAEPVIAAVARLRGLRSLYLRLIVDPGMVVADLTVALAPLAYGEPGYSPLRNLRIRTRSGVTADLSGVLVARCTHGMKRLALEGITASVPAGVARTVMIGGLRELSYLTDDATALETFVGISDAGTFELTIAARCIREPIRSSAVHTLRTNYPGPRPPLAGAAVAGLHPVLRRVEVVYVLSDVEATITSYCPWPISAEWSRTVPTDHYQPAQIAVVVQSHRHPPPPGQSAEPEAARIAALLRAPPPFTDYAAYFVVEYV